MTARTREEALKLGGSLEVHSSRETTQDQAKCPQMGSTAEEINAKEETRLNKEMVDGTVSAKPTVVIEGGKSDEDLTRQRLAKMEARKKEYEEKLKRENDGDLPAWYVKHQQKEERGEHLGKKTVDVEYTITGRTVKEVNPALRNENYESGALSNVNGRKDKT
eukprot:TRINITY_DN7062_c0_g1_i1.p1 TRINITY_DN7062_c0_g1~~TRINITY_DN7062_c0_g1_i1.p1  ORF type:complete len:163 (+),score=58.01 TRINITY_DN7062_c0_g1_i1:125-613(+)